MNNKISALLTNKHSKYSIRKRTVGTASLLIGATLVFGIHAEDAKAAENTEATDAPKVDNHQVINDEQLTTPATEASATEISAPEVQSSPSGETKVAPTAEETTIDTHSETNEIETTPDAKEKLVEVAQVTPVKAPVEEDISRKQEGEKQPTSSEVEKAHTAAVSQPRSLKRAIPVAGNTTSEVNRLDRVNQNVNDLIKSDTSLTVIDADKNGTIVPAQDYIAWKSLISVDDKVNSGDHFTIKYSDTIQMYGLNPVDIRNIGDVVDRNNGETIATAVHDTTNKVITYTFTDYVDRFNSVKMNMDYSIYMDSAQIPQSKTGIEFGITVGNDTTTTTTADINYPQYKVVDKNSIGSAFTETVSNKGNQDDPGYYIQTIYVNPLNESLKGTKLNVQAYHPKYPNNVGQINQDVTNLKIYQVPKGYTLNQGYDINTKELNDVTETFQSKIVYGKDDMVTIDLGDITTPFVVVVNSKFEYTDSENPTLVQMATLTSANNRSAQVGNALGFTNNASGGIGKEVYKVGNYVWHDSNQNGIQELGEEGVGGVTVEVFDTATNTKVGQAVTNADGSYLITNIPNGTYRVEFSNIPDQYKVSPSNQGGDDQKDSNGLSSTITVNGKDNLSADLGIYKPTYKIGDYVWYDGTSAETDGIQNNHAAEHPIQDVIVKLYDETGTKLLQETKTNREGYYEFAGLEPNRYVVEFTNPEGYKPVKPNQGTTATDSNITQSSNRVNVTIVDKDDLTIDAGYFNEVEPPKEERFNLGDKVWEDLNKDGIQNENEPGIKGVKVTLTKEDGSTVETTTDENGNYKFTELPNGKYKVVFETPEGYEATKVNVGDTALDSDGQTVEVVIDNKDDMSIDSGFHKPEEVEPPKEERFNLGDKVWEDLNKDGIQNENEPGIKGVKVTLTKEDGSTVETTTDENGNYKFTELPNGKYKVVFETPEGYEATKVNVGDTALDSDGQTVEVVIDNKDDMSIDSGFHKPTPEVPEQPGEPETPTPEVPEQPGEPETPTPEVPEQPGEPETPTPEVPEQPGKPETPTPEVPEQPGEPEAPTPDMPEQPGEPEVPTPDMPEQPGEPEAPTPDMPEQPREPEAPTPDMPEQPSEPKTPTPVLSEQPSHPSHKAITRPVSVGTQVDQTSHPTSKRKKQALPETGQSSTNEAPLLGGLLAVLGALFVVGRRKKQKNQ
ncbi:carboxypeptidase regulatory-like domain-containing protein [Staphylococcus pseudintermedius]|nr:carboxypeptidase regulatory-like domain-containing protein [Staphylococcus pseudintermedius]